MSSLRYGDYVIIKGNDEKCVVSMLEGVLYTHTHTVIPQTIINITCFNLAHQMK